MSSSRLIKPLAIAASLLLLLSLYAQLPPLPAAEPATADTTAASLSPAADSVVGLNLVDLFHSGGLLMWPILLCSIVMIAFTLERAFALRQAAIFPEILRLDLKRLARAADTTAAIELLQTNRSAFARLMLPCLQRAADTIGYELETALEESGARLLYDLRRNCKPLAVIADISPLLGLMGTVTGMIKAFDVVARSGALGRTELLAEGISEALLTTAFGLLVAIPAVVFYNIYRSKAENMLRLMEDAALEIIATLRHASRHESPAQ